MAQFEKLISFIGSKRLVFRENFSHSARDKIARATGGAGHRGNGRPDWSNLRVDVEGDDFVECTVYYIQCDLGNCIMNIIFVCLFRCCSFWSTWDQKQSGLFLLGFRTQVDSMGFGTQRSQIMQRRLDTKTSPRGSWGSWASGRNPKFLLCNLWLWKRYHQRPSVDPWKVWVRKVHLKKGMKFNGATGIACILADLLVDPGSRHIQMTSIVS